MDIKGGRFLVVGGAGLIGSHVVDQLLSRGAHRVLIYDNFSRGKLSNLDIALTSSRCHLVPGTPDILDRENLRKCMLNVDGVFHLAASWLLQCNEQPRSAYDVNVMGTLMVAEAAIEAGVRRLIFSSSASVYGEPIHEPIRESHPYLCSEIYGATKAAGELMLRALYDRGIRRNESFRYVGLRYMNVYGPRQDDKGAYIGVITRMLNCLDKGMSPVVHGDGSQAYDFINVRDCALANIKAMESATVDKFYNVGTGIKTSILDLLEIISRYYSNDFSTKFVRTDRPYVTNRVAAVGSARRDLGFEAKVPLGEGIEELINWRRNRARASQPRRAL